MSRWYSIDGNLHGQVPTLKGGLRDFDLRDARKEGALPSVTTLLQLLAKPGLVKWQVQQGIKATIGSVLLDPIGTRQRLVIEPKELVSELTKKSEEWVNWTADFGTATHWWLNKKLRAVESLEIPPMIPGAEEVADGLLGWFPANGYEFSLTEHRFARSDLGYAGTVDLVGTHFGSPCIVDIKTQEPPLTPHEPEYSLQLAGYDMAIEPVIEVEGNGGSPEGATAYIIPRERISIIANRLNPGEAYQYLWVDKGSTVAETNARYDRLFLNLVELWIGLNRYDPRSKDVDIDPTS